MVKCESSDLCSPSPRIDPAGEMSVVVLDGKFGRLDRRALKFQAIL
jgi:hypothetical protein